MIPVSPGFAGQVPDAFVEKYPGASYTKQTWKPFKASNLSGVYMISSLDPKFANIGDAFLREQEKEFGTNHVYSVDPFNELLPPNSSVEYLSNVGRAVFQGLGSDKEAAWLMQGWLFMFDQGPSLTRATCHFFGSELMWIQGVLGSSSSGSTVDLGPKRTTSCFGSRLHGQGAVHKNFFLLRPTIHFQHDPHVWWSGSQD